MTRTVSPMMLTKSSKRRQRRPSVYAPSWSSDVFEVEVNGKLEIGILAEASRNERGVCSSGLLSWSSSHPWD